VIAFMSPYVITFEPPVPNAILGRFAVRLKRLQPLSVQSHLAFATKYNYAVAIVQPG
jgi:hypothetical protein